MRITTNSATRRIFKSSSVFNGCPKGFKHPLDRTIGFAFLCGMARRVFFSFHYKHDAWRVSQVRNSWLTQKGETNTFMDAAAWEAVKKRGDAAVKAWIDRQLQGTGVTVVLIGTYTASREFVMYEIEQSYKRRNGLLGIYINRIRNSQKRISRRGKNPLDYVTVEKEKDFWLFTRTYRYKLSELFKTYDWVQDDGRNNIGAWIEDAASRAGR